jgi:hypothetical protein
MQGVRSVTAGIAPHINFPLSNLHRPRQVTLNPDIRHPFFFSMLNLNNKCDLRNRKYFPLKLDVKEQRLPLFVTASPALRGFFHIKIHCLAMTQPDYFCSEFICYSPT